MTSCPMMLERRTLPTFERVMGAVGAVIRLLRRTGRVAKHHGTDAQAVFRFYPARVRCSSFRCLPVTGARVVLL